MARTGLSLLLALTFVCGLHAIVLTPYRDGECSLNAFLSCDQYARCIDSADGQQFTCQCLDNAVGDGFKTSLGGTGCKLAFKPCATNKDCPQYATCSAEYKCVCNKGFQGDGFNCTDINECLNTSQCDPHATCTNSPGTFACLCDVKNGYYGDGLTCTFKCASNNDCDAPRATCNDANQCVCVKGYEGDGRKCTDVNECLPGGGNNCNANANCNNTVGSFKCECKNGYTGNGVTCTNLPKSCKDISGFVNGNKYKIDPDFTGPANAFTVICDKINGVIVTKLAPTGPFPMLAPTTQGPLVIGYEPKPSDIQPLLENLGFCIQDFTFNCNQGFALFPGTKWYDAYGNSHINWGSTKDGQCACGELKLCPASCYCDGTKATSDAGRVLDKRSLPIVSISFNSTVASKGSVDIGPLICSDVPAGVPKDCNEAKWTYNVKKNTPLYIDPDGPAISSLEPYLVYCDMESYFHVGVTNIVTEIPVITVTTTAGVPVSYTQNLPKIVALISGSAYCSQRVEFRCKRSRLFNGGGSVSVTSAQRQLNYFPGAGGVQNSCGCGVTNSCQDPSVKCNCDIGDDVNRKDFGLIIDKKDLPVISVTAESGEGRSATYVIGNLQCSQRQFGIQPNCEKYRQGGETEDYTYWADPGGPEFPPNDLPPFPVVCQFVTSPPQGITIIHHTDEKPKNIQTALWLLSYLAASKAQIAALIRRSTFCSQKVEIGCNQVNIQTDQGGIQFTTPNGTVQDLNRYLSTCGTDGRSCGCNGNGASSDSGVLADLYSIPINSLDFSKIIGQLGGGKDLTVTVGPLKCAEVFSSCAELQAFLLSDKIAQGEAYHVQTGYYTMDPDGSGEVPPFSVKCTYSTTTITITTTTAFLNPDPNDPLKPVGKCFDIGYTDDKGNAISAAQVNALAKKSGKCKQDITLECKNAPATNNVNYTSCDGTPQKGWAGSFKADKCACGVNGNCAGGSLAKCNCDMNDNAVRWDGGTIINIDSLPVCQICFSITPKPGAAGKAPPTSSLKYTIGELVCDGGQGTRKNCQDARNLYGTTIKSDYEASIASSDDPPSPFGCRLLPNPPIGILVSRLVAETPLIPVNTTVIDVNITYITMNITVIRKAMQQNEYCTQNIYFFCASAQTVQLGGRYGWYSYSGGVSFEWRLLSNTSDDVKKICTNNKDLCTRCGNPIGYAITQKDSLPVARLVLPGSGATIVIGDVECFDLKKSCQDIVDSNSRTTGFVSGKKFVIDVDSAGPITPFVVNCEFNDTEKTGVTEVPVTGNWTVPVRVKDKDGSTKFELPITYDGAVPNQINGLSQISNFCWQGVEYGCKYSPIQRTSPASTYLNLYQGQSQGFGIGKYTYELNLSPGCPCSWTGTCTPGYSCNCDALGPMGVDQGFVTDKANVPIVSIVVGGQIKELSATADITVSGVRCSSKPNDPPIDCDDAFKKKSQYGIKYNASGVILISPRPGDVRPFLVQCDDKLSPGNGVTIVRPKVPPSTPVNNNPDTPNDFPYYGPTDSQILALIAVSKYCYQGVIFSCFGSTFLNEGTYWQSSGSKEKRHFWGGGEPSEDGKSGVCACGKAKSCGGLDSATAQIARRCNCDAGDSKFRSDAGIIDLKEFLPVSKLQFGRYARFQTVNVTLGDLICSQTPLTFNECELGFFDCDPNARCVDEDEGYRCVCKDGWNGKGLPLTSRYPRANGRECIDDDECVAYRPCPYSATCTNTLGDFYCTCKPGYTQTGKTTCEDVNECADSTLNSCDPNARCENLDGSYRCICDRGYRGDGFQCIPVGECSCFGDPHCNSFDGNWLHFQGLCTYTMARDGCQEGEEPTFRVLVKHWQKDNLNPGSYAWIQEVYVYVLNFEIKLQQNGKILVNGNLVRQYFDEHRLSILMYNNKVKIQTVIGLEVTWDGKDVVQVVVPEDSANKMCGLCGNYNGNPGDDLIAGPACPEVQNQQTNNPVLFGNSWTALNYSSPTCEAKCGDEPPSPDTCRYTRAMIEKECDKLFDINTSPFRACLLVKKPKDIEEFRKSCVFDLCRAENNLDEDICRFAQIMSDDCANNEKVEIKNWKKNVDACEKPTCTNNMIYKDCGPAEQETCISKKANDALQTINDTQVCTEGCFCADHLVMEGDRCIKREECGCFYNNGYMATGDVVILSDCSKVVTCYGKNITAQRDVECNENEECRNEDGVTDCYCKEGYVMREGEEKCQPDNCFDVTCAIPNMECFNGTCVCKMGFIGDCNQCDDIDECATGLDNCTMVGQTCINIAGSFKCGCEEGFVANGQICKDIDECDYGIDDCGDHSECVNTPGSFLCECCLGYKKDASDNCVRDTTTATAPGGKCCACQGEKCGEPGKVCGSDGTTYSNYRSLSISGCKVGNDDLKVEYNGACQGTCATVICGTQYSNCSIENGKPVCSCPTCEDSTSTFKDETVCATNKITYTSICHMKKATCEAEIETKVEVESTGKPCPGNGGPAAGPWSDWGDCSEACKQGTKNRTRDVYVVNDENTNIHNIEFIPCYNTCPNGPCTADTCEGPGQVCVADDNNNPSCQCPTCEQFGDTPVCGRVREVIQTYENECELEKKICELKTNDYEVLEPRACEDKPVNCSAIRNYRVETDSNGCKADRSINFGACYGGCDNEAERCCFATELGQATAIVYCPDGSNFEKSFETIVGCNCVSKETAQPPADQVETQS
ncbi:unnamed protein product [Lymnaea stagnalis]|uniref:Uncharacterized protein n=1 Tax=Lymnaea stagnalis TaxID=6523 RepID=A0AAV2IAU0_LYMST